MGRYRGEAVVSVQLEGLRTIAGFEGEFLGGKVGWWARTLYIFLGAESGGISFKWEVLKSAPADVQPDWEDCVELTAQIPEVLTADFYDAPETVLLEVGDGQEWWRLRISARGRDKHSGEDVKRTGEKYLLQLWPDPAKGVPVVTRLNSMNAEAALLNPTGTDDADGAEEARREDELAAVHHAAAVEAARHLGERSPEGRVRSGIECASQFRSLALGRDLGLVVPPLAGKIPGNLFFTLEDVEGMGLRVATGFAIGSSLIFHEPLTAQPAAVEAGWEDVTELSVKVGAGPLLLEGDEYDEVPPSCRLDAEGPGWYRVRIHGVNRALEADGVSEEALEQYLVQAWPEPVPRDLVVWREEMDAIEFPREADPKRATDSKPKVARTLKKWKDG